MKTVLKLEALGLMVLFTAVYFHFFPSRWGVFLALFFVPDIAFLFYFIGNKAGAIAYNILHHQGLLALLAGAGFYMDSKWLYAVALVFLAHSFFDRVAGYGLKYADSFHHTHLGHISGKAALENVQRTT